MQVVILAAGRGKRMGNLTLAETKPMLKIGGKPILEYKLNSLPRKIKEVIIVVGYRSMHIISHFKRYYGGKRIIYVFQNNLNGTGGALHLVKSVLRDKFLVLMGDDFYHKKDLSDMLNYDLAILGSEVSDPGNFGVIRTDQKGNLVEVLEKPQNSKFKMVNTGAYVLNSNFFDYELVSLKNGEYGLPQTLAKMSTIHKIKVLSATAWHPIGNAEDLEKAEKILHRFV